jgi:lipoyl(octanoyl) transferase
MRLIIDPPAAGAWNMAVDEALLETAATTGQATLRLYQWQEPTLSLGYFQAAADRQQHLASCGCPLVRRSSGGGAIVHDRELTYGIAVPQPVGNAAAASRLIECVHQTLIKALAELGITAALYRATTECRSPAKPSPESEPFLCFRRRACTDIIHNGEKIIGSAQRRRRGAALQHGSILLGRSCYAPELPGIEDLTGGPVAADEIARRWLPRLEREMDVSLVEGKLSEEEQRRAGALVENRFGAAVHLGRR